MSELDFLPVNEVTVGDLLLTYLPARRSRNGQWVRRSKDAVCCLVLRREIVYGRMPGRHKFEKVCYIDVLYENGDTDTLFVGVVDQATRIQMKKIAGGYFLE